MVSLLIVFTMNNLLPSLPYDIIYSIYFHIYDYNNAKQFWLLNKSFTKCYMSRYSNTYRHLFSIIFVKVFDFLSLIPHTRLLQQDIDFLCCVESHCSKYNVESITNDIQFIYLLYRNFLHKQLLHAHSFSSLVNMSLVQGPIFLDNYCTVVFDKNKVTLVSNTAVTLINDKKRFLLNNRKYST